MIHIITIKHLKDFGDEHPQYLVAIETWTALVRFCTWEKPQDMVNEFGPKAVDLLGKKDKKSESSNRVVFDLKGNHLRLIFKYQFHPTLKKSRLYLKWIGTHKQYTALCKKNEQYDVDMFN